MGKWLVELQGDPRELEHWRQQFPSHGDPYISDFTLLRGNAETKEVCGISCCEFERMDDASTVHATAEKLFAEMKGWVITKGAQMNDDQKSRIGAVYEIGEDKRYRAHHFIDLEAGFYQMFGNDIDIEVKGDSPKPTRGQSIISGDDDNLKAVLRYIATIDGNDWRQLYRAFEAIGKKNGLKAAGIPKSDAARLVQTFSLHRHHKPMPLDGKPMSFHGARSLIFQAIRIR